MRRTKGDHGEGASGAVCLLGSAVDTCYVSPSLSFLLSGCLAARYGGNPRTVEADDRD